MPITAALALALKSVCCWNLERTTIQSKFHSWCVTGLHFNLFPKKRTPKGRTMRVHKPPRVSSMPQARTPVSPMQGAFLSTPSFSSIVKDFLHCHKVTFSCRSFLPTVPFMVALHKRHRSGMGRIGATAFSLLVISLTSDLPLYQSCCSQRRRQKGGLVSP